MLNLNHLNLQEFKRQTREIRQPFSGIQNLARLSTALQAGPHCASQRQSQRLLAVSFQPAASISATVAGLNAINRNNASSRVLSLGTWHQKTKNTCKIRQTLTALSSSKNEVSCSFSGKRWSNCSLWSRHTAPMSLCFGHTLPQLTQGWSPYALIPQNKGWNPFHPVFHQRYSVFDQRFYLPCNSSLTSCKWHTSGCRKKIKRWNMVKSWHQARPSVYCWSPSWSIGQAAQCWVEEDGAASKAAGGHIVPLKRRTSPSGCDLKPLIINKTSSSHLFPTLLHVITSVSEQGSTCAMVPSCFGHTKIDFLRWRCASQWRRCGSGDLAFI